MGQFSWKCSVCGEQILSNSTKNEWNQAILVTPQIKWREDDYDGYGVFGGIDAYTWLACHVLGRELVNTDDPKNESLRQIGIDIQFSKAIALTDGIRLIHQGCDDTLTYNRLANSESDPNQGWLEEGEDSDEWV